MVEEFNTCNEDKNFIAWENAMEECAAGLNEILDLHLARAALLIQAGREYETGIRQFSQPRGEDLLRSAVVYLHAALEDTLRTVAERILPLRGEDALKDIPLPGATKGGRGEKFILGDLIPYRDKRVQDLIRESVSAYLDRQTFNHVGDIKNFLTKLGIDTKAVTDDLYVSMGKMIRRRHLIVHNADCQMGEDGKRIQHRISADEVHGWQIAVLNFFSKLILPALGKVVELEKERARRPSDSNGKQTGGPEIQGRETDT